MGIYLLILILLFIIGDIIKPNKSVKNKKIYMIIAFIILGGVAAIRSSSVGTDTDQFTLFFCIVQERTILDVVNSIRYEVGFVVLCKVLGFITTSPQILIIVTSIFINGVITLFIYKESKDVVFSIILYIALNYYFSYMNIMRQALAISIILLGYILFLKKNKKILFILSVMLASAFHTTAILVVAILFFKDIKYKMSHYIITVITSLIAFLLAPQLFMLASRLLNSYSVYVNSVFYESNYFVAVFIFLINFTMLTVSFFSNRKENRRLSKLLIISSIAVISSAIGIRITLLGRMANYFNIYNIVLLPNAIQNNTNKITRKSVYLLALIFSVAYFLILLKYRPEWYQVIPYTVYNF